jgi:hypothetical protein
VNAHKKQPETEKDPEAPKPGPGPEEPKAPTRSTAIKVKPALVPEEQSDEGPRRRYWCGTLPGCPIQNVHVAGVLFPRWTGVAAFDDGGKPSGELTRGIVVELTGEQVQRVCAGVASKAIRPLAGARGVLVTIDRKGGSRKGDVPLARHLYMIDLDAATYDVRSHEPEPMEA